MYKFSFFNVDVKLIFAVILIKGIKQTLKPSNSIRYVFFNPIYFGKQMLILKNNYKQSIVE
jgi:hypothetical protein